MSLFSRLLDLILPPRRTALLVRDTSLEDLGLLVSPITIPSIPFPTTALLPYPNAVVSALIQELKFRNNKKARTLLSTVLADYLSALLSDRGELENAAFVLVPVPLSLKRRQARGYNQVALVCEAALTPSIENITLAQGVLERVRDTVAQTELSGKERLQNMRGAFRAAPLSAAYIYIVVDDVTTTGATLAAAVAALTAAGAKHVMPLALAH